MRHNTLIDDRESLESSVWMLAHPARMVRRWIERRARVVQHDKRAQLTIQIVAWKQISYVEPVPNDVLGAWLIDLHLFRPLHIDCLDHVFHCEPLFLRPLHYAHPAWSARDLLDPLF